MAQHEGLCVHRKATAVAAGLHCLGDRREIAEEGRDEAVEMFARGSELHPVLGDALEQGGFQLSLEFLDLLVHRWLGDGVRKGPGGAGVTTGASHPVEALEALDLDHGDINKLCLSIMEI